MRQHNRLASIIYNTFLQTFCFSKNKLTAPLWNLLWTQCCNHISSTVTTNIHGYKVLINFGHPYPIIARQYQTFNNPLIELVYQTHLNKKVPISFIDVGAGIGDTVLLLEANCPEMIGQYFCFDGNPEFFFYLKNNIQHLPKVKAIFSFLSSTKNIEKALIHTHKGTASALGNKSVKSCTLDSLILPDAPSNIDILKVDVDGFDGQVLLGARDILKRYSPSIIFEWHPALCKETGNNWIDHFKVLFEIGYNRFIWFNKFGEFSHFMECLDTNGINELAEFCLNNKTHYDWHYDVIALHADSPISPFNLAETDYAKNRKSIY